MFAEVSLPLLSTVNLVACDCEPYEPAVTPVIVSLADGKNPVLILEKPNDKIVVKFTTDYNKQIDSELEISSFSEFDTIIKNLKENVI